MVTYPSLRSKLLLQLVCMQMTCILKEWILGGGVGGVSIKFHLTYSITSLRLEHFACSHVDIEVSTYLSLKVYGFLMQGRYILVLIFARNYVGFPLFEGK